MKWELWWIIINIPWKKVKKIRSFFQLLQISDGANNLLMGEGETQMLTHQSDGVKENTVDVSTQTDTVEKIHKSRMCQTWRYSTKDKGVRYSQQSKSLGVQASISLMNQVTQTKSNPLHNVLKCQSVWSPMQQDFESGTLSSPEKAPISEDSE